MGSPRKLAMMLAGNYFLSPRQQSMWGQWALEMTDFHHQVIIIHIITNAEQMVGQAARQAHSKLSVYSGRPRGTFKINIIFLRQSTCSELGTTVTLILRASCQGNTLFPTGSPGLQEPALPTSYGAEISQDLNLHLSDSDITFPATLPPVFPDT